MKKECLAGSLLFFSAFPGWGTNLFYAKKVFDQKGQKRADSPPFLHPSYARDASHSSSLYSALVGILATYA
jgi:hypothetical protein